MRFIRMPAQQCCPWPVWRAGAKGQVENGTFFMSAPEVYTLAGIAEECTPPAIDKRFQEPVPIT